MKRQISLLIMLILSNVSWAHEDLLKRCKMTETIALDIAFDRDHGVNLYDRLQKNDRITRSLNTPESQRFMKLMIDQLAAATYGHLKSRPSSEIGSAAYVACMKSN